MRRKTIKIFLTGGLGNQLFQFAASMHFAGSRSIELDAATALPKKNKSRRAELLSLNLPSEIKIIEKNKGRLTRKVFGFNLRSGFLPNRHERTIIFKAFRAICSSLIFGVILKKFYLINVSGDLGYDFEFKSKRKNEIAIGYFQTFMVTDVVKEMKHQLFIGVGEEEYLKFKLLAKVERPLLVHVRLGDYKGEETFGILSSTYYWEAIKYARSREKFGSIWLFSDDPEEAIDVIPADFHVSTRIIETRQFDSAVTLRIMSLCSGFIIANSSFSWWAAMLSEPENPIVVAPIPWFTGLPEPKNLIPPTWKRFEGFAQNDS